MVADDDVFMTADEVLDFVHSYALSRYGYQENSALFDTIISDLESKKEESKSKERDAYIFFGVNNIKELQDKFNTLIDNNSSLRNFSNEFLNKAAARQNLNAANRMDIQLAFQRFIQDNYQKDFEAAIAPISEVEGEKAVDRFYNILEEIIKKGRSARGKNPNRINRTKLRTFFMRDLLKYLKSSGSRSIFVNSEAYKEDIQAFLQQEGNGNYLNNNNSTYTIEYDAGAIESNLNGLVPISYYPYFNLTKEQEVVARNIKEGNGKQIWENFCDNIVNVVTEKYLTASQIKAILNFLGPSAFIKNDFNGVVGIMGELQVLFFVQYMVGDSKKFLPTGPLRNALTENKAELGADVLLNKTLGIQVKNYREIPVGDSSLFQLRKEFGWDYIAKKFENNSSLQQLGDFFTALSYNQPIKNATQNYQNLYKFFSNRSGPAAIMTQAFFAANIDKFITFNEAYILMYGDRQLHKNKIEYDNVFFVFGGTQIVPVSAMIDLLLKRMIAIREAIKGLGSGGRGNSIANLQAFFVTNSYSGPVYPMTNDGITYSQSEILKLINFKLTFNLKISDLELSY